MTDSNSNPPATHEVCDDRWRLALEGARIGVWDWTLANDQVFYSAAWKRSLGHGESDIGDRPDECLSRVHPDDVDRVRAARGRLVDGRSDTYEIAYRIRHRAGHWVRFVESCQAIRDASCKGTRLVGCDVDVTERREREGRSGDSSVPDSEAEFSRLASTAPVAIFRMDSPPNCVYVNQRWIELVGRPIESALGTNWMAAVHPDDLQGIKDHFESFVKEAPPTRMTSSPHESRICLPDGTVKWLQSQLARELDRNGEVCSYVGTLTDVTDRKHAEALLKIANEELARATRMKDEFLANMSHELRSPLTAILAMTEGMQEGVFGALTEKQLETIDVIQHGGTHLLELINEVLDLAKIESGQIELELSSVDVRRMCESSLGIVEPAATKKRIELKLDLASNLPEFRADVRRLRQVLINLLNNAVKFTPEGGRVRLSVERADSGLPSLCFCVSDTGIGVSPELLPSLFLPFFQIDTSLSRRYDGTGLGLALVKRFTELHGGHVRATSKPGVGSSFFVELPFRPSSTENEATSVTPETAPTVGEAPTSTRESAVVLLAEDHESIVRAVSAYLQGAGYGVEVANNGQAAIDKAVDTCPDLVLMDIQMPGLDGLEAIARLRELPELRDTPIIAMTGLAMSGDQERCFAAGANEYLSKPFRLSELVSMVDSLLAR